MFIQVILLATILSFVHATLPANLDASSLPSTRGVLIEGTSSTFAQNAGSAVRNLGDMNKDGIDDYAVGAKYGSYGARQYCGLTYVMYGSRSMTGTIDLGTVASSAGYQIIGEGSNDFSGSVIGSADVNGDGYKDILVGVQLTSPTVGGVQRGRAGITYVIYGKASRTTNVDLASLSPADGFKILGAMTNDFSGNSISSAGDINKDGFEDFLIGASSANRLGRGLAGVVYVLYGKASFTASIDLAALKTSDGFQITGAIANGYLGNAVSYAGDFNKDGVDDIAIGAHMDGPNHQGITYVLYGKKTGSFSDIDLSTFASSSSVGVRILGESSGDQFGFSVASAGDFNGDGVNDLVVGANFADPSPVISNAGAAYVIYGKTGSGADIQVSRTMSSLGLAIYGAGSNYNLGYSVSGGDFDQDGFSDVILGANQQTGNAGVAYVIIGKPASAVSALFTSSWDSSWGYLINGVASGDTLGSSVDMSGDINGDGLKDALIGAPMASPNGRTNAGAVYALTRNGITVRPTASPTQVPSATPTATPSNAPSVSPSASPTLSPSAAPTAAAPTVAPTKVPTAVPTLVPTTAGPTMSPSTAGPTVVPTTGTPTVSPTQKPTSIASSMPTVTATHSDHQIQYSLTMDLTGVLTAELTPEGKKAMENTIAVLTGLPTSNVNLVQTVSSTPVGVPLGSTPAKLRSEATTYILKEEVLTKVDMSKDYDPETQLESQCNNHQQKLGTFVNDGSFQVTLRAQAALLSASELANVVVPHDSVISYSTCQNVVDASVDSNNKSASSKLAAGYVAAICAVALFVAALCFCCLYGYMFEKKENEKVEMVPEKVCQMKDAGKHDSFKSSFAGIYDCNDEVDFCEGGVGKGSGDSQTNCETMTLGGYSTGSGSRSDSPPTLYKEYHFHAATHAFGLDGHAEFTTYSV
jgi:hypothetical protein